MYNPTKPYKHALVRLIESTWRTPYVRVESGVYPIIHKKFSYPEVQHSDGIGTKGHYHWRKKSFKNAVRDALAMNLNDLALVGAVPYALQDHIVTEDTGSTSVMAVMRALASECRKRKIAITGGETSHHNTVDGIDIGITVTGFIKRVRKNVFRVGDVLLGMKSSGLHANGFTKVRSLFGPGEWRDEFVVPTAIYLDTVLEILKKHQVNGMMHITGGAFTKIKDLLEGADAHIHHPQAFMPQPIFHELYERGVSDPDMYATFNCGIGFVLAVPKSEVRALIKNRALKIIGEVTRGTGKVHVTSAFSGKRIIV
ncbi:MAG: AIR synthase-related protein [Patescibacteria group bacterium]